MKASNTLRAMLVATGLWLACSSSSAWAQTYSNAITLDNPNWNITLTDYGYSDYLLDNSPGFQGREYLSGEWGAAIKYNGGDQSSQSTWLEPQFVYPDWATNSNFHVVEPIAQIDVNSQNLPIAESIISNGDVQVTLRYEIIDTLAGMALGLSPASAGGAGSSVASNRFVLQQTYTVQNLLADPLTNVSMFQFLHHLTGDTSIYDNRSYGGAAPTYHYGTTQTGFDASTSNTTVKDAIGFNSAVAPVSYEAGLYGTFANDNHQMGKPSVGTHLSVESGTLNNNDFITSTDAWVSGAQKYSLGTLNPGQSKSLTVLLSIASGSVATSGDPGVCHIDDNSPSNPLSGSLSHGVEYEFADVTSPGTINGNYDRYNTADINEMIASHLIGVPTFAFGSELEMWNLHFTGSFDGLLHLVFHLDDGGTWTSEQLAALGIYHFNGTSWDFLGGVIDPLNFTISIDTTSLSPFAVGFAPVPEPATWVSVSIAMVLGWLGKRRGFGRSLRSQ